MTTLATRRHRVALVAAFLAGGALAEPCGPALARFDYGEAARVAEADLAATPGLALPWICLARAHYERGDFSAALAALRQAESLAMTPAGRVLAWNWFGVTLRKLGRREEAWRYQQAALALARQIQEPAGLGTALHNMAGLLYDTGQARAALDGYRASLAINPDAAERSASLNNMGLIEADLGHPEEAARLLQAAIELNRREGHFHHLGKHLLNLGNLRRGLGDLESAQALIAEGTPLIERAGDRYWLGWARRLAAWVALDRGQRERAEALLRLAEREFTAAGAAPDALAARREREELGR